MTDKEMAEEYFEELRKKKIPFNIPNVIKEIKQAYLAGLKAGRPEWHKVADGDLPKETGEYLTNIGVLIWDYYADGRYGWHTKNCEFCDCCDDVDSDEVIAWCEIPKYTEE